MYFYLVGDAQVKGSKNEQSVAKKRQKWAKQESMPRHGSVMPQHEAPQLKTQGRHAAAYPIHAAACQGGVKMRISIHAAACPNHVAACQGGLKTEV